MNVAIPYSPRGVQAEIHNGMNAHRFSVVVAHRRLGKSVAMINQLILKATQCKRPMPKFAYVAPYYSQAKEIAWDYLKYYTKPLPNTKINESELWVKFPSISGDQARIKLYGADKPDSIRGIYLDGCVIDEVAQCRPEIWGEVIRPLLSDRHGWCCFIGTPRGRNLFFDLYQEAVHNPEWFAGRYPVSQTKLISQKELDDARKTMGEAKYRQEFLCDFEAAIENALIPAELVDRAVKRQNLPSTYSWAPIVIGVDVARYGDDKSVIYVRQGLHTIKVIKTTKLDLMSFADKVANTIVHYRARMVFVDVIGVGAGVVDRLFALGFRDVIGVNAGSKPDNPRYRNKRAEMWDKLKEWLEAGGDLPNDNELTAELTSVQYQYAVGDKLQLEKKEDMKARGVKSPDCFIAGTMIATISGQREIQNIVPGDIVITPFGEMPVLKLWESETDDIVSVTFRGNKTLTGKSKHEIYTSKGFLPLTKLMRESAISTFSIINLTKWRYLWELNVLCFGDENTGFRELVRITTGTRGLTVSDLRRRYTEIYGNTIPASKYLKATVSTTLMGIPKIMCSIILNSMCWQNINRIIVKNDGNLPYIQKKPDQTSSASTIWQRLGTKIHNFFTKGRKLAGSLGKEEIYQRLFVSGAVKLLGHLSRQGQNFVQYLVGRSVPMPMVDTGLNQWCVSNVANRTSQIGDAKPHGSARRNALQDLSQTRRCPKEKSLDSTTIAQRCAHPVVSHSPSINQDLNKSAVQNYVGKGSSQKTKVYNLTVDRDNVYYANGVLVSNCGDALALTFSYATPQDSGFGRDYDEYDAHGYESTTPNKMTGY